ncbi:MAG: ATP-dependent Clp protease proteolytic subunit, partial [Chloroflexi bacterium]|nr:ATP-dependent Clp protease proteolytic subunit [Chloroflexota bacterium]
MNERSRLFTAVVVLSVALGIVAAAAGFGAFYFLIGTPRVGVISLEGDISTSMANRLSQQLRYAEQERSIRAVVLRIDSPGGGAPPS